jgi:tRNA-splicing ligase RtcB
MSGEQRIIGGKKASIYAENVDPKAMEQFCDAMKQDFVVSGALMPDAHAGYSLPIGAVVATDGVVVSSWVGYDIGCGMCAIPTTFSADDVRANASGIFDAVYRMVPVGFKVNDKAVGSKLDPKRLTDRGRKAFETRGAFNALGTLGSGNHFIEVGEDESGKVWIIVHSGSRGIGHGVATAYMKLASGDGKAREGHFGFDAESDNGRDYVTDMDWTLAFALENRQEIVRRVVSAVELVCGGEADWDNLINRNHNHAEKRDGKWIHRKGATHAEDGMMGVVPGNMRDGSFIVRGKGNPEALYSSSHGAGRVLGRRQAKDTLKLDDFEKTMKGVKARVEKGTLDESPMAYKDIEKVMEQQKDLIEICAHVRPIINIKG